MGNVGAASEDLSKAIELKATDGLAFLYRGLALDAESNYEGAVVDFAKAAELAPVSFSGPNGTTASYGTLYRALDLSRMGRAGEETFASATAWKSKWAQALAAFVGGKLSEAQLLQQAGADVTDDGEKAHEKSEALYFVGRMHLVKGDNAGAAKAFNDSFQNEPPSAITFRQARNELDRMPH